MAITDLTVQQSSLTGLARTLGAANADGSTFTNSGRSVLEVVNGSASPITVTIDSKVACNQGGSHDVVVSVAAGATKIIGPFPQARFNDGTTGKASVIYSDVSSVTVAVVEVP